MKHKYFEIYIRTVEDTLQLGFFYLNQQGHLPSFLVKQHG